ncbi:hypothetical protein WN51_13723 [Melipona quadrifasciata]|uniref:DUF4773 domain-containing protein n=1 Tax=Melipona quadrifasciata TaxID=166423 RepID=A0A0M8ZYE9_9HYME|nr:hypothetical protein WN51_13723 [Melipona quadrifasciata]
MLVVPCLTEPGAKMRLSMVVELLLILLLIAFAAYGRVIERDEKAEERAIKDVNGSKQSNIGISTLSLKQATDNVNRYCTCNENICNCCRDFHIPLVQLQGPGNGTMNRYEKLVLYVACLKTVWSNIVARRNPRPVCVPLPGGFTKFCGRIYSIKRDAKNHFKACLGLELQSATELEASLRVSCFRFGPDGLKLRPAEPLPVVEAEVSQEEDDDFFGLDSDEDDEDDDDAEDDAPLTNSVPTSTTEDEEEDDDEDVLGFGALLDIITGEDETTTKKPKVTTVAPLLQFTIPILNRPTSPLVDSNVGDNVATNESEQGSEDTQESLNAGEEGSAEASEESAVLDAAANETEAVVAEVSNKIVSHAKPDKTPTKKFTASDANRKKPSVTSSSINAIENETNKKKKYAKKPVKGAEDDDDDILEDSLDDEDDDDEDEEILSDKDNEEEEDEDENIGSEHENHEDEDEKAEIEDLDDDDDEEEDAVISALVYDEKENGKKKGKVKKHHQSSEAYDDDSDYELGLTGLLARSRHSRNSE